MTDRTDWRRAGFAVLFLALAFAATETTAQDNDRDRAALVSLYHATDGPNWDRNINWLSDRPLDVWYGVGTSSDGRVWTLRLNGNGLNGEIPDAIGDLVGLHVLDLGGGFDYLTGPGGLSGPIPAAIGNLEQLGSLDLSNNNLSGPIPYELANLTELYHVRLDQNPGLCLPPDFPESRVRRHAWLFGMPDCAAVPVLPWPAVLALGAGLAAGSARVQRRRLK